MRGGYRGPHVLDEPDLQDDFADQFEYDRYGLTFRKSGRGRPVRVTPEERDETIAQFDRIGALITQASVAAGVALIAALISWVDDDLVGQLMLVAGIAAIGGARWIARKWYWNRIVSRFSRRTPVGPDRTLMDQYRAKADAMSWGTVFLVGLGSGLFLWLLAESRRPTDVLDAVVTTIALAGVLGLALLKLLTRRA